jgi:hypothetical protein
MMRACMHHVSCIMKEMMKGDCNQSETENLDYLRQVHQHVSQNDGIPGEPKSGSEVKMKGKLKWAGG